MAEKQSKNSNRGGKREGAGRPAGVPNKMSSSVKENVIEVFDAIGGVQNMAVWATENQTQFYNLYAKLLPHQLTGENGGPVRFQEVRRLIVDHADD